MFLNKFKSWKFVFLLSSFNLRVNSDISNLLELEAYNSFRLSNIYLWLFERKWFIRRYMFRFGIGTLINDEESDKKSAQKGVDT